MQNVQQNCTNALVTVQMLSEVFENVGTDLFVEHGKQRETYIILSRIWK